MSSLTRKSSTFVAFVVRSYSECCIDDVTASHAKRNDLIVKFGHSCFTTQESSLNSVSTQEEYYIKQLVYVIEQI